MPRHFSRDDLVNAAELGMNSQSVPEDPKKAELKRQIDDIEAWMADYKAKYPQDDYPDMYNLR